jgi:hypothetical protein
MKDEVIVFIGPQCCGIPAKARAQGGHAPANAQQKTRRAVRPGLAAQFFRVPFYTRVAIRGQEKFSVARARRVATLPPRRR